MLKEDGSPIPTPDHFFRKAVDQFQHDQASDNKIVDLDEYRQKILMEKVKQSNDVSTKGKVSSEFIKELM